MKKNNNMILVILFILFYAGCGQGYELTHPDGDEAMKEQGWDDYLKTAKIVSVKRDAVPGRTGAWKITLDDGSIQKQAFFKHVHFNRPTILPDSYTYELAAYVLAKWLDFQRIPPVVEREIEGVKGSLQLRVENCMPLDDLRLRKIRPPDNKAFQDSLEEINVFENLTYCERKELDDILIHKPDWKVWRVDFSEAFSPAPELIPEQEIVRCSKKLFHNLLELKKDDIRNKLKPYLNQKEISGLIQRKILIIETIQKLVEENGEELVLF